jgi:hypothetical protein
MKKIKTLIGKRYQLLHRKNIMMLPLLSSLIICSVPDSIAQDMKYRRSSLTMVLVEDNDLGKNREMVINAYNSHPFPDKYNLHSITDKRFSTEQMSLTINDYKEAGFYKDTLNKIMDFLKAKKNYPLNKIRMLNSQGTIGIVEPTKEELNNIYINKYINDKKIAKQIVSTWYNRTPEGAMDWNLLKERALYTANQFEKEGDSKQALTDKLIKDIDVVGNTFVVFNKMDFYENEPVARLIRDAAKAEAIAKLTGKPEFLLKKALEGLDQVYEKTKEGYTVKCNTYLYQLEWTEEIAKKTNNWFFNSNVQNTKEIWDTTNLYKLKFVGKTVSGSIVTFKIGETRSQEEIINLQVKRTMDNALAKLQRTYSVFRPVTPVYSTNPLTAQIGMKEGVEPGDKYEILKSETDEKTGLAKWKSVGKISVDKKQPVWDNRPGAEPVLDSNGNPIPVKAFTTFKGGKSATELNFIRFVK